MIKLTKTYKNALNKYGTIGVLNMYRDGKIKLNSKEWKSLHRKIDKENQIYYKWNINTIVNFVICLIILVIASFYLDTSNHEKIKQCNEIQGHTCSKYEIESMGE